MNIIFALVIGVLIGWGSCVNSGTDGREELIKNVAAGSVGAYLGGWMLTAVYGSFEPLSFSLVAVVAAMLGAATSIVVVHRIRCA